MAPLLNLITSHHLSPTYSLLHLLTWCYPQGSHTWATSQPRAQGLASGTAAQLRATRQNSPFCDDKATQSWAPITQYRKMRSLQASQRAKMHGASLGTCNYNTDINSLAKSKIHVSPKKLLAVLQDFAFKKLITAVNKVLLSTAENKLQNITVCTHSRSFRKAMLFSMPGCCYLPSPNTLSSEWMQHWTSA